MVMYVQENEKEEFHEKSKAKNSWANHPLIYGIKS
jgi:hypothetical protein